MYIARYYSSASRCSRIPWPGAPMDARTTLGVQSGGLESDLLCDESVVGDQDYMKKNGDVFSECREESHTEQKV